MNQLIAALVKQLGIQESQAQGGAGLLFKLAQDKLGGDFSKVTSALPGVTDLIKQAPQAGGASSLLGGLASAIGGEKAAGLASLAAGFSQLKLDPSLIGKFAPVILGFVKAKAGPEMVALLSKVMK